jgi:hypothetical protein
MVFFFKIGEAWLYSFLEVALKICVVLEALN